MALLPDTVAFCDEAHQYKTIDEIGALEGNCQLVLPKEMNSIQIQSFYLLFLSMDLSLH